MEYKITNMWLVISKPVSRFMVSIRPGVVVPRTHCMNLKGPFYENEFSRKYFAQTHYLVKGFYWCENLDFFGDKFADKAVDHEIDIKTVKII